MVSDLFSQPRSNKEVSVRLRVFHEKVVFVKQRFPLSSLNPLFGVDQREAAQPRRLAEGPLSLIYGSCSGPGGICPGRAGFWRGLRTLDRSLPVPTIRSEGKGAGGLAGLAPRRSMRQPPTPAHPCVLPAAAPPSDW